MTISGRLLNKLTKYPVRPGWFTGVIQGLAADLHGLITNGSAISGGGVATIGTVAAGAFGVTTTAVDGKIGGNLKAQLAALALSTDLFTTAATVGQAIFTDGSDASAILLAAGETAQVALVVSDSDGAGASTGDNGAMLYSAVVAGTATTYSAATAAPSDADIEAAFIASAAVHSGATGWARLANIDWIQAGGSTVTVARDS